MVKKLTFIVLMLALAVPAFAAGDNNQQYTVQVYLYRISVLKVVEMPGDTMEDLCGNIRITNSSWPADTVGAKTYAAGGGTVATIWSQGCVPSLELGAGQSKTFSSTFINLGPTDGLTRDQVVGLSFGITGDIRDWEPLHKIEYKECDQCGGGKRTLNLSSWTSQIDAIAPGTSKYLNIGGDDTFQLDWYEADNDSSHVRALLKIRISRKAG